ncbi:PEP motif putative anchor domain protein [Nitrosomonas sp. Is79A3]|uniref:PEP-CTERM sorting domain-containing protein n=1 Tax=Nitrosomonas sp. (strain Is79A3) TaxID=261292 RepID=UPI000215CDF1
MKQMKCYTLALAATGCLIATMLPAQASVVWGNSASSGNVNLEAFDTTTGLLVPGQQFLVPNPIAVNDNGRGVAVLGNDIYYTTASSGNIYKTNAITHADLGIVVNTGFNGIANIATDGTYLYANDYQATNGVINKYTTAGVLAGSITLTGPDAVGANSRDGFEVQNNPNILGGATTFIANRYDGGFGPTNGSIIGAYDVYDSNGVEIISGFITPNDQGVGGATGIAFDGTNYFVSDIFNNRLLEYSGLGVYMTTIDLSGIPNPYTGRLLEDLSAVGNTIDNPPPVPEPETYAMLLAGLGLLGFIARRRKENA